MATPREVLVTLSTTRLATGMRRGLSQFDSGRYWERRYAKGGTSGPGSYGADAQWKANIVNEWVRERRVASVLDLGCGDGNQLALAEYPRYLGLDRSRTAIRSCIERFAGDSTKSFVLYDPDAFQDSARWMRADLSLSMEVLFHLVEEGVFNTYLSLLFDSAERYVIVCSTDVNLTREAPHERYRPFTPWVRENRPDWRLLERVDPPAGMTLRSSMFLFGRETPL